MLYSFCDINIQNLRLYNPGVRHLRGAVSVNCAGIYLNSCVAMVCCKPAHDRLTKWLM